MVAMSSNMLNQRLCGYRNLLLTGWAQRLEWNRNKCKWICINSLRPTDAYMRQYTSPPLIQIMACRLLGAKPFSEPMLLYCQLDTRKQIIRFQIPTKVIRDTHLKMPSAKWRPYCLDLNTLSMRKATHISILAVLNLSGYRTSLYTFLSSLKTAMAQEGQTPVRALEDNEPFVLHRKNIATHKIERKKMKERTWS